MSHIKLATFDKNKEVVSVLSGTKAEVMFNLQFQEGFHALVPPDVYAVDDVPPAGELELIPNGGTS